MTNVATPPVREHSLSFQLNEKEETGKSIDLKWNFLLTGVAICQHESILLRCVQNIDESTSN